MTTPTTQPDDRCEQIAESYYTDAGAETPYHCLRCKVGVEKSGDICGWCEADQRNRELRHQPKSEPSRECEQIAKDLIEPYVLPYYGPEESKLEDRVVKVLQAKQDELNALREEVLGVIEPFAVVGEWFPTGCESEVLQRGYSAVSKKGFQLTVTHCRAALALRDKLKASQPTSPPPQTPHQ